MNAMEAVGGQETEAVRDPGPGSRTGSDAALLGQTAAGDADSFRALFERHYPRVYRFVLRITRRSDLAEEAASDALFEVWRGAGRFKGASKISTWILGIARHKALNALRTVKDNSWEDLSAAEEEADPADGPAEIVEARDRRARIRRALETLAASHRAVLELAFFHGLSYSEIAQVLDCPENTVKTRVFHAKKKLGQVLSAFVGEES